jgi:WD40 repeat protein
VQVKFSPDGRWVLSSGKDGSFNIWDLTSSRLLHSFTLPKNVHITSFEFNPQEVLLAAATTERLVSEAMR